MAAVSLGGSCLSGTSSGLSLQGQACGRASHVSASAPMQRSTGRRTLLTGCRASPLQTEAGGPTIPCDECSGRGWLLCDFCEGKKTDVQVRANKFYRRCPSCKAVGVLLCPKCRVYKCLTYPDGPAG